MGTHEANGSFPARSAVSTATGTAANQGTVSFLYMSGFAMPTEHEMAVTHLRDHLGFACQMVAESDEPVVVTRYRKGIVALVPLWEWRFFKELEADLRAGRKRIVDDQDSGDSQRNCLDVPPDAR